MFFFVALFSIIFFASLSPYVTAGLHKKSTLLFFLSAPSKRHAQQQESLPENEFTHPLFLEIKKLRLPFSFLRQGSVSPPCIIPGRLNSHALIYNASSSSSISPLSPSVSKVLFKPLTDSVK
ncbi:MAG: hypothetical protein K0S12_2088 [Bacteroidetes bacterium]|jgi:hypothetical protein|nr:hypothetical protein [Bacteroidota bacterium]